jgi:hypothetical protein
MIYSTEQLELAEELAGLLFSEKEIKIIIDTPDEAEDSLELRIIRGRLKTDAEVRRSILNHAKGGSSPAQTLADRMKRDLMIYEYLNENKR